MDDVYILARCLPFNGVGETIFSVDICLLLLGRAIGGLHILLLKAFMNLSEGYPMSSSDVLHRRVPTSFKDP